MFKRILTLTAAVALTLSLSACAFLQPGTQNPGKPGAQETPAPSPTPRPTLTPLPEEAAGYAYHQLTETEQQLYALLYDGAVNWAESVEVPEDLGLLPNEGYRVMDCVLADHPEIFWQGGSYRAKKTAAEPGILVEFIFKYAIDRPTAEKWQAEIDIEVNRFLAEIESIPNEYERALAAHSWLTRNAAYAQDVADRYMENEDFQPEESRELAMYSSIYGAIVKKNAICSGFAHAFQYLCGKMGFVCTYVSVDVEGVGHAVNLLQLEGRATFVDVTYDVTDDMWHDGTSIQKTEHFGLNDELFERLYDLRCTFTLPLCPGLELHAISRGYGYFPGEYDSFKDSLATRLREGLRGDVKQVTVQIADPEQYNVVIERFVEGGEAYEMLNREATAMGLKYEGELRVSYSPEDPLCVIKFYFGDIRAGA
ncbi:MAG: hypothetical protein FWD16_08150 [Clostridia bacterium]|nr:hypothetical protein [Clostridia bacterium]